MELQAVYHRVRRLQRKADAEIPPPRLPPGSGHGRIFIHGFEVPRYNLHQAKATYSKFVFHVLHFHQGQRGLADREPEWKLGKRTRLPNRREVEQMWLYQIQARGSTSKKIRQRLINQMHGDEAENIWNNVQNDTFNLKTIKTRKERKQPIGQPSTLCPPEFKRHTNEILPKGVKREHGDEDTEPNKRLKPSQTHQTQRKKNYRKPKTEESWAAALHKPAE